MLQTTVIRVTEDISLDCLEVRDFPDLVRHINDPVLFENTLTVPYPYTTAHAESYLAHVREFEEKEGIQKDWIIRYQGKLIGGIGALYNYGVHSHKTEIGYWISSEYRGRGFMTKVIGAFVMFLFEERKFIRVEANVFVGNSSSARVLEKNGFVLEGTVRAAFIKNGQVKDTWLYALLKPA